MKISNENIKLIKRILSLFKPYSKKITAIITCIIVSSGLSMLLPLISKQLVDKGLLASNYKLIVRYTLISFSILLVDQGIGLIETKHCAYLNSVFPFTLQKHAFKHTLRLKMQYLNNTNFAEIMTNIGMDVGNISRLTDRSMFFIFASILRIIGGFIGLLIIDASLTVLVILMVPVRYLLVKYLAKKRKEGIEKLMEYHREYGSWYGDTVNGVKEVKLWDLDRIKIGQFIRKQKKIIKTNITLQFIDKLNELSESTLIQFISNALYLVGAYMVFNNNLTIGGLFAFITYSSYVTGPVSAILNIGYHFTNVLPSAKRLFNFLDLETEQGSGDRKALRLVPEDIKGHIAFENVSFAYSDSKPVLENVSFEIQPGEKVAIIGANGSGKSTIINLILRYYKPDSGRILLDGVDINQIKLREYRRLISVVSQDLYLFDASVRDNIAIAGNKNEECIQKATVDSTAQEFIEKLPQKFDTRVGRNGTKLSGGERQKIAVARAFVRESKIMLLDEATSNFDRDSESSVNEIVASAFEGKSLLVVTHKPDILRLMDRIILLEQGKIRASGSHEELYIRSETYRSMIENREKSVG